MSQSCVTVPVAFSITLKDSSTPDIEAPSVPPLPSETVAKVKVPDPSVYSTWPLVPSAVGNAYALLNVIVPVLEIPILSVESVANLKLPAVELPAFMNISLLLVEIVSGQFDE